MRTADQNQSDQDAYALLRLKQREQPRTRGSWRRNKYLLDRVQGDLPPGTRAKNRGPYPAHLVANCRAMAAKHARAAHDNAETRKRKLVSERVSG